MSKLVVIIIKIITKEILEMKKQYSQCECWSKGHSAVFLKRKASSDKSN